MAIDAPHQRGSDLQRNVWWIVAWIPAACWLATATLVLRSRAKYGVWPTYGAPDPSVFGGHYLATTATYLLALAVVVTGVVAVPLGRYLGAEDIRWRPVLIGLGLLAGYVWFLNADVAGISTWLGD